METLSPSLMGIVVFVIIILFFIILFNSKPSVPAKTSRSISDSNDSEVSSSNSQVENTNSIDSVNNNSSTQNTTKSIDKPSHYYNNLPPKRVEPWISVLLSFIVPGAGQMYSGRIGRGIGLLLGTIIGSFFLVLPGIAVYIYNLVDAFNVAQENNEEIDRIIELRDRELEKEKEKKIEEIKQKQKSEIRIDDFKNSIVKNKKLFDNDLISKEEYFARKSTITNTLLTKKIVGDPEDFLFELISLKTSGILTDEEIKKIKTYLL